MPMTSSNAVVTPRCSLMTPPLSRKCQSFRLDPQLLDDRPPFLGIGLLQGGEHLRRLSLSRKNLQPEIDEPRAHSRVGRHSCRIELTDDVLRRAPGREKPEPAGVG